MKSLENESSVTTSYKESVSIMDYESLQTSNIDIGMIHNVSRVRSSLRMALDILSISIKLYLARLSFVAKRNSSFGLHNPDELLRQLVEADVTVSLVVDQDARPRPGPGP